MTAYRDTLAAAAIAARLDRLRPSRAIWSLVVRLSLGGCFEFYDLFLTGYLGPGLKRAGIFHDAGWLGGLSDQATFAAATFAGLFFGTILFAQIADRFGRRAIFTISLLWYTAATLIMSCQTGAGGIHLCRFAAGLGIGVELVTIDAYIAELVPSAMRGRAFAVNQAIQFTAVPLVALSCWILLPLTPLGLAGWRWVLLVSAAGAAAIWFIRASLPDSPRWLAQQGRFTEAEAILDALEARTGHTLPSPIVAAVAGPSRHGTFGAIFRPPFGRRTLMLSVFNFCQAIGFYGFGNWLPSLVAARGHDLTDSLLYSGAIALAYPIGPLLCAAFADRFERKWQIVAAAIGTAVFGLVFAGQTAPLMLVVLGVLITVSNNLMSFAYHTYQAELYPTAIRARAVGFVYAWSRFSTIFTSYLIAFFLRDFGTAGVFSFIGAAMVIVVLTIGLFGPRTRDRPLDDLA